MSYISVVQKYLLSSRSPSICCELYQTSKMVGLVQTYEHYVIFMPILSACGKGLYYPHRVNSLAIYPKLICILFDLVHLHLSFIDFLIGRRHVSSP